MKAFLALQRSIIVQSAAEPDMSAKFNDNARKFIAVATLGFVAAVSSGHADAQITRVSNCSALGAVIGAAGVASAYQNTDQKIAAGLFGGIVGKIIAEVACDQPVQSRNVQNVAYQQGYQPAQQGGYQGQPQNREVPVERSQPRTPLSISERTKLDKLSFEAVDAKYQWKIALYYASNNLQSPNASQTARENEAQARQNFEEKRSQLTNVVVAMNSGTMEMPPKAMGRYLEVVGALNELDTRNATTYSIIESNDVALSAQNPNYAAESRKAAEIRAQASQSAFRAPGG